MRKYALKIEYDGTGFSGWQRQRRQLTVQQCIEEALASIGTSNPRIIAAGRTDSGVHAKGQVVHCELEKEWSGFRLGQALNANLRPHSISVLCAAPVGVDFNARTSAIQRTYLYRVVVRRSSLALDMRRAWRVAIDLDIESMQEAADYLVGKHDFTTFRSAHCQADSPVRTMDQIMVEHQDYDHGLEILFTLKARSFLHRQVRSIVGTLKCVGAGAWTPDLVKNALEARDRSRCGAVAPAHGLYLVNVEYPTNPFESAAF